MMNITNLKTKTKENDITYKKHAMPEMRFDGD